MPLNEKPNQTKPKKKSVLSTAICWFNDSAKPAAELALKDIARISSNCITTVFNS